MASRTCLAVCRRGGALCLRGGRRPLSRAPSSSLSSSATSFDAGSLAPLAKRHVDKAHAERQSAYKRGQRVVPLGAEEGKYGKAEVQGHAIGQVLVNGVLLEGSVLATRTFHFLWAPQTMEEVTLDSLAVLRLLHPKTELLLFGTGSDMKMLPEHLRVGLRDWGIKCESMASFHAATTFNMLNEEERMVALALLPETHEVDPTT